MYRSLLAILLCQAVTAAPQLFDSDITYVQLQPSDPPRAPSHYRESRIENLPLTIPGIPKITHENKGQIEKLTNKTVNDDPTDDSETLVAERSEISESIVLPDEPFPESTNISEETILSKTVVPGGEFPESSDLPDVTGFPEIQNLTGSSNNPVITDLSSLSEQTAQINGTEDVPATSLPKNAAKSLENLPQTDEVSDVTEELLEAHGTLSDTVPAQSERRGRTYESGESTDIFDEATERYEDFTQIAEVEPPRTRAPPKFIPKLSYFSKPTYSLPVNSLEKAGKRRFRSNCRCEKIWNCPKLQITVPRCPDEYFLCCF